jgi:hypothetical protein
MSIIRIRLEYAGFFINHLVCSIHLLKMSTCPRCGTGNFKEGRSLSMHLSRFCSGPTLLCNTLTGLLPSKRSTQQIRLINLKRRVLHLAGTKNSNRTDRICFWRNVKIFAEIEFRQIRIIPFSCSSYCVSESYLTHNTNIIF